MIKHKHDASLEGSNTSASPLKQNSGHKVSENLSKSVSGDCDGFWRTSLRKLEIFFDWKSCSTRHEFWCAVSVTYFLYALLSLMSYPNWHLFLALPCILFYTALVARRLNDIRGLSMAKYIWGIFWLLVIISYPFRTAAGIYADVICGTLALFFCIAAFVKGKTTHQISTFIATVYSVIARSFSKFSELRLIKKTVI